MVPTGRNIIRLAESDVEGVSAHGGGLLLEPTQIVLRWLQVWLQPQSFFHFCDRLRLFAFLFEHLPESPMRSGPRRFTWFGFDGEVLAQIALGPRKIFPRSDESFR